MSFGRPGALSESFKVTPPQRGSFPLDHDGEFGSWALGPQTLSKLQGGGPEFLHLLPSPRSTPFSRYPPLTTSFTPSYGTSRATSYTNRPRLTSRRVQGLHDLVHVLPEA